VISPVPDPGPAAEALRTVFGFESFRAGQEEVVEAVLAGRDALCVMPTGAGKSLCFQLPAVVRGGLTLVVSPLIALMQDQVESLRRREIAAAAIHSAVSPEDQDAALDAAARGELRLLYVAPERFRNRRFRRRMQGVRVELVAVDEAHCISRWGHDFRPDYRRLGGVLETMGSPQVLALTATAPPEVQDDVVAQLGLRDPVRFVRGIVRANLAYEVLRVRGREAKDRALRGLLDAVDGATLVYCATRKEVDRVHAWLRAEGRSALRYHAGLPDEERARAQEAFLGRGAPLMLATNAFGMGVDRPDIRCVVHHEIPRSIEAYVQESGRAGRDGRPARCLLLYDPADLHVQRFFIESSNPSREVIVEVFRVLQRLGHGLIEATAEEIAGRAGRSLSPRAVSAALAVLDRAAVVRRARRDENLAQVTVLPAPGDLFAEAPLPPGLGRMLAHLVRRHGVDRPSSLDPAALAAERGVTPETVRRGLSRLHELGRIEYVPAFRGRATEVRDDLPDDALAHVDFDLLEAKRRREEDRLEEMIGLTATPGCRVRYLLSCFGVEASEPCGACDRCTRRRAAVPPQALEEGARETLLAVLQAVRAFDKRYGFRKLAGHLAGSRADDVCAGPLGRGATYGQLAHLGVKGADRWLRVAFDAGLLRLVPHQLRRGSQRRVHLVALAPLGLRVLKGEPLPEIRA
jgi:ATP-dependent DNA helicase RecQ